MNRKIKNIGLASLVGSTIVASAATQPKKNVVIIIADDFNYWNTLQGYYPLSKTPNLDNLSRRGVLFSDAQAAAPVSNPSRTALWSGFRPSTTGIVGNDDGYIRTTAPFQNIVTMNQYFVDNGYWVYGGGKLYHGNFTNNITTNDVEHWPNYSKFGIGSSPGTYLNYNIVAAPEYKWSVNSDPMTANNCNDFGLATEVAGVISNYSKTANKDKPFFMACGFSKPHLAWYVPKRFYDLFNINDIVIPKSYKLGDLSDTGEGTDPVFTHLNDNNKLKEAIHMYLACLALADHNAGVIINAINNTIYKDNTIIVFMGDHGWHLGEKNRLGKASPWDLSNKTTLIIYDPSYANSTNTPNICKKVVSLQDLYPTLVELSGLPIKTNIEGNSIAALIENPNKADWDKPVAVTRVFDRIRTNKWSYVDNDGDSKTTSTKDMLYDIENDPDEFDNLLHPDQKKLPAQQVAAIRARLVYQLDSIKNIGLNLKSKLLANYKFTPKTLTIPGVIEAEDYDEGGYTQSYYDADKVNSGGTYRTADGTDIYITDDPIGGSFHLKGLDAGDWCKYTVKDFLPGDYSIKFRVRNTGTTPAVIQVFNRDNLMTALTIPALTNNWKVFPTSSFKLTDQYSTRLQIKVKSGTGLEFNNMGFESILASNSAINANISRKCLVYNEISDNVLHLDLSSCDIINAVSIYDVNGKLVSSGNVPGEQMLTYTLPKALKRGMYFLRVSGDVAASVEKFIVK